MKGKENNSFSKRRMKTFANFADFGQSEPHPCTTRGILQMFYPRDLCVLLVCTLKGFRCTVLLIKKRNKMACESPEND